jgi:hypothetical protein
MRTTGASTILFLLIAGTAISGQARAQEPSLAGSYVLVAEQSERVEDAVKEATDGAGFFVKTVGRRMLTGKLTPAEQLRITVTDSLVVLGSEKAAERAILVVGDPNDPRRAREAGSDHSAAFAWWDATVLGVRFAEEEGAREHRYWLDPDGRTLRVEVRVNGDKLPRPVELSLTYARQEPVLQPQRSEN